MDPAFLIPIGVVGAAAITGYFTWRVTKSVNSGDVKNTQASDLWKESQSMRAELRAEVADLRAKVSHSQIEIEERRKETLDLNRQYASCQAQLDDAKMHMASQQAVITDQVREIAMLRGLL
jgi:peptidoglycan hydrolase CwlO-like protein